MKPYRPANGTEGEYFIEAFCERCYMDRNEDCPILARSFEAQVPEWVMDDEYENAECTAFVPDGPDAARKVKFPQDEKAQLLLGLVEK